MVYVEKVCHGWKFRDDGFVGTSRLWTWFLRPKDMRPLNLVMYPFTPFNPQARVRPSWQFESLKENAAGL
jgi:hypothetical protein